MRDNTRHDADYFLEPFIVVQVCAYFLLGVVVTLLGCSPKRESIALGGVAPVGMVLVWCVTESCHHPTSAPGTGRASWGSQWL